MKAKEYTCANCGYSHKAGDISKEEKQSLINEAKQRYKKGDIIKSLLGNQTGVNEIKDCSYCYMDINDGIWFSKGGWSTKVYFKGKWAEKVKEPVTWDEVQRCLIDLGFDVIQANKSNVLFWYNGNQIIYYIKKKWVSGKGIEDGRGWNHLIKQITR